MRFGSREIDDELEAAVEAIYQKLHELRLRANVANLDELRDPPP